MQSTRRVCLPDLNPLPQPLLSVAVCSRWERAAKFGMDPPQEVKEILQRLGPEDASSFDIWHGRV